MKKFYFPLFGLLLLPAPLMAADQPTAKQHSGNMQHCMPGMDAHCRMNQAMEQMEKEMGEHRAMQHCMPNMTARCQAIADLEYMEQRMANMRVNMQHCMEDEKSCPMPEMSGEMKAMRDRMDAMSKQIEDKMPPKPDEKGQIDTQHERDRNIP